MTDDYYDDDRLRVKKQRVQDPIIQDFGSLRDWNAIKTGDSTGMNRNGRGRVGDDDVNEKRRSGGGGGGGEEDSISSTSGGGRSRPRRLSSTATAGISGLIPSIPWIGIRPPLPRWTGTATGGD